MKYYNIFLENIKPGVYTKLSFGKKNIIYRIKLTNKGTFCYNFNIRIYVRGLLNMKQCLEHHGADMTIFKKAVGSMKKSTLTLMVISLSLLAAEGAYAMNARNLVSTEFGVGDSEMPVAISLSTGVLNGEGKEFVYGDGDTVSQLNWDLKDVYMLGLESSVGLGEKWTFNLGAWTNVNDGTGYMTDYDYFDYETWTISDEYLDKSKSNSDVDRVVMLDTNLSRNVYRSNNFFLNTSFGFRYDNFKWGAYDGYGTYTSDFPDIDVEFYGDAVSYEQELYVPYIGLDATYNLNKWSFNTYVKGSCWAFGEGEDTHHYPAGKMTLREPAGSSSVGDFQYFPKGESTDYKDEIDNMSYISYGINASYLYTDNLIISLTANFQKYFEEDGDETVYYPDGSKDVYKDGGGLSNESYMIGLSTTYLF